jgi:hypothetical protein
MMADAPRPAARSEALRRMDDAKIGEIFGRLGRMEATLEVMAEKVAGVSTRLDREVLRRVELSEVHHAEQDHRIDVLEQFRDETRGALNLIKILVGTSVLTAILTLISIVVILTNGHLR